MHSLEFDISSESSCRKAVAQYLSYYNDRHLSAFTKSRRISEFEVPLIDYSRVMKYSPTYINKKISRNVYLIRYPSCKYREISQLKLKFASLKCKKSRCPILILDLRGNTGGCDGVYVPILRLIHQHDCTIGGLYLRNTKENVQYFKTKMRRDRHWRTALSKCENNTDRFVCLFDHKEIHFKQNNDHSLWVAVIIDNMVASSAEQLILDLKSCSDRIIIYGHDNSMGCLHYSNSRPIVFPEIGITITVPMTKSCHSSQSYIDEKGIKPDVSINIPIPNELSNNIDSWVFGVADDMESRVFK